MHLHPFLEEECRVSRVPLSSKLRGLVHVRVVFNLRVALHFVLAALQVIQNITTMFLQRALMLFPDHHYLVDAGLIGPVWANISWIIRISSVD